MDIYALVIYFYVTSPKSMVPILHVISNGVPLKAKKSFSVSPLVIPPSPSPQTGTK